MRPAVVPLLLLCALPAAAGDSKVIGPDAAWKDAGRMLPEITKACDSASDYPACFAKQLAAKAPAPVTAFARALHNEGWMRAFRNTGRVSVAYVVNQFRANENDGWLFVNGSPSLFDPDDFKRLNRVVKHDPAWDRVIEQYPKAMLFPGDRTAALGPVAIEYPDGSQLFIAGYRVMDGCHACAILGNAFFTFEFNHKGKFTGARFAGFDKELVWPLQAHSGDRFTLILGCEGGCNWTAEQPPADSILQSTGIRADAQTATERIGYRVTGSGTTQFTLRNGATTLVVKVAAAPGLRHSAN